MYASFRSLAFSTVVSLWLCCPLLAVAGPIVTAHIDEADIDPDDVVFVAEGRIGNNNATNGTFELDLGLSTVSPAQTAQYRWRNGVNVPFELTYDGATGMTFTVNGIVLNFTLPEAPGGLSSVYIRTKATNTTALPGGILVASNLLVNELTLDGMAVGDVSNTASFPSTKLDVLLIQGDQLSDGFSLTGRSKMTWDAAPSGYRMPRNSELAYQIKVAVAHTPEPGSIVALAAIGVAGAVGYVYRRRRIA
jgi:hypothetical protein